MKKEQIIIHKHVTQLQHNPQNRAMRVHHQSTCIEEANKNKSN